MPRQLIQEALQQAQECAPAVQAAALVHAARVLAVFDKDAALSTVERGLALADGLPEKYRIILMPEAIATAAAVSPDLALAAYAHESADAETLSERMAFTMLHHGHVAALASYLSSPHVANTYPFLVVGEAIYSCKEDLESQQAILRAAITAARQNLPNAAPHHFWEAFDRWWTILPEQEAKSFLLEFVDLVLQQPDNRGSYRMGHAEGELRFASTQQWQLFEILGPLRSLDPHRATALINQYPELARAAEVFPYGRRAGLANAPSPEPTPETQIPSGPIEWDPAKLGWVPVADWMKSCWEDLFKQAMAQFDADTAARNPNRAPHEVWPSTQSFRQLMYRAGRYEGTGGVVRLKRIPDLAVRLLAKIEFVAGLLDLPMLGYSTCPPIPLTEQMSEEDKELESPNLAALPIRWKGRGKVRKISLEIADWDPALKDWAPARHHESSTFRPDGQLEVRSSALASVRYRYDGNGKLVDIIASREGDPQKPFTCEYDDRARIVRISREFKRKPKVPDPFSVMSSSSTWIGTCVTPEGSYVVNLVKVEIRYDDADHPVEISYTAEGGMSARFTRTWNAAGRVETESQVIPKTRLRPGQLCSFTYDTRGRCVEFKTSMEGTTEDYRTRFLYDDHDNMIEAGGSGGHERYEYDYDAQGNWVQRVTWTCPASQSDYRPTKVERRTIGYAEPHVESL
jgi:hypothetical protein